MRRIRLINLNGNLIAEAEQLGHAETVLFSNRVFLFAFQIGEWKHFREVAAERITIIETLSTSTMPKKENNNESRNTD